MIISCCQNFDCVWHPKLLTVFCSHFHAFIPEYHDVGGGLGEGGDEAGDTDKDHEGEEEVRASAATCPRRGKAETADTPALSVVLHKQTHLLIIFSPD